MAPSLDVVALTQALVAFDTTNPPGDDGSCVAFLADLLDGAGFDIELQSFADQGTNLVAKAGRPERGSPILFTGHMDTVPLGDAPWSKGPFAGEIEHGKLYGRGTSDMKGGLAAICVAAISLLARCQESAGVTLAFTDKEETGCQGAAALCSAPELLGEAGAIVVAEPSSNVPLLGHKGAFWLRGTARGLTAHGSTPELGENAVYSICRAVSKLERFDFEAEPHSWFDPPTLNVGLIRGGLNTNSVPDYAEFELDIRSSPTQTHDEIQQSLSDHLGVEIGFESMVDLPGVFTDENDEWAAQVRTVVREITGIDCDFGTAKYFTDASILTPSLNGAPTLVLGPGDADLAHVTDEYVRVEALHQAVTVYRRLIENWCTCEGV